MKRSLLILGLLATGIGQAFAGSPNYYYVSSMGSAAPYNWVANGNTVTPTTIISAPANDVLSTSQTIPFKFTFYGQTVSSYKASDNGYITFDPTATKSIPNAVALPSTSAPRNAIFGFWTDLNVPTATTTPAPAVRTWTYGNAPNRIHVIEWVYVAKNGVAIGNTNFLIFSIRLYEAGGFDVVHTTDEGTFGNAVIGAQDTSGTIGEMVNGSPFLGAPNPSGTGAPALDLLYTFIYGTQPTLDATLTASVNSSNSYFRRTLPTFVAGDNGVTVNASVLNNSSLAISGLTLNYSIDGGATESDKITGANVSNNGGISSFTHTKNLAVGAVGQYHNIKIWLSDINDSQEEHTAKDTVTEQIFVINGGTFNLEKKPILEEITGAWCGYCPDGHLDATALIQSNPLLIVVTQHTTDSMMTTNSSDFANYFGQGLEAAPFGTIDRHYFTDDVNIQQNQGSLAFDRSLWQEGLSVDLNTQSVPVSLDILTKSYNPTTRQIQFTVTGTFSDYAAGNVMLNAYIVEDSCRGSNSEPYSNLFGWNQHNYYSSKWSPAVINDPSSPLYNEPASMIGYLHNHVVRKALTGSWGEALTGSNPAIVTPNQTFTKTFTYTLPPTTKVKYTGTPAADGFYSTFSGEGCNKPDAISLVAFVSCFNATDPTYNEVLNATQAPLLGWSAGVAQYNNTVDRISIYPNPTAAAANLQYSLANDAQLTIEVYNVMGQKVQTVFSGNQIAGTHITNVNTTSLDNGLYFVRFTSNGMQTTKQLMIQK